MFVVKVYDETYGILCLFKVVEFSVKDRAVSYAQDMLEKGFAVEVYERIKF